MYVHAVRFSITADFSIFSSNQNETHEFVSDYSSFTIIMSLIALLLIPLIIYIFQKKNQNRLINKVFNVLFFLLFFLSIIVASCNEKKSENKLTQETDSIVPSSVDFTIVFASCNDQDREQPLWNPILENKPDLFIWGGDNDI